MSVKRRDLVRYLEQNGYSLLREGGKHSIYSNGVKTIPVKRHRGAGSHLGKRRQKSEVCSW